MNEAEAPGLETIAVEQLSEHIERGDAFLLDLRHAVRGAQIYGAIRYDPKKLLDAPRLVLPLPKSQGLIVVYDEDGTSKTARQIGAKLRTDGYAEVRLLAGGFAAWQAAAGRTEEPTMEQIVPLVSEHQVER
jgi:rhodanese-related sulfurtransferase